MLSVVALATLAAAAANTPLYKDPSASIYQRADDLLARMTPLEKQVRSTRNRARRTGTCIWRGGCAAPVNRGQRHHFRIKRFCPRLLLLLQVQTYAPYSGLDMEQFGTTSIGMLSIGPATQGMGGGAAPPPPLRAPRHRAWAAARPLPHP